MRTKDLEDICYILQHYLQILEESELSESWELLEDREEFSVSARLIGRKIGEILSEDESVNERVVDLVESEISKEDKSNFIPTMSRVFRDDLHAQIIRLEELKRGMQEGSM